MDGRRHLAVAQKLVEGVLAGTPLTGGDGAPECRSASSRAYYAAFWAAAAFLDRIGFAIQNSPSAHTDVQRALNNSGNDLLEAVASELRRLHDHRKIADYEPRNRDPELPTNADTDVRVAADLISCLDEARDNTPGEQLGAVAAAVSAWLKGAQTAGLRQKSGR